MNDNNYVVLMAGGSGTRLWPISRRNKPKQFHKFSSDRSLLQDTYDRIKDLVPKENIYVSIGPDGLKETSLQLKEIAKENYIIEPISKNTAPSVMLIAAKIFRRNPQAIITTISSDHTINKVSEYKDTFRKAFSFIDKNPEHILTIGIKPDSPHTGYGYIKAGRKFSDSPAHEALEFVEKPDLETAQKYVASGKYFWNASYFTFRADWILKMYEEFAPEIYNGLKKILNDVSESEEEKIVKDAFEKFSVTPVETAIMEKADKIAVIPADLGWSDVGSWASLYDLLCDNQSDKVVTRGHHIGVGDKNCLFFAEDKLLATVGLEDIIIVDTPDATLVCHKDKVQQVKELIAKLKEQGKANYL